MEFDTGKYKVWTWKHPIMLHWRLNPGLVINELLLGQAVPKVMLVEKGKKGLAESSFIPCPHCHTIHSGLKWSVQNKTAFGNWFGLYCDHCGDTIPPLRNFTSLLLLGLTFPFWMPFRKRWKRKWLSTQKEKFSKPLNLDMPAYNWVKQGLGWGAFMFVAMDLVFPLIWGEALEPLKLIIGAVVWTLAGLGFGYVMKLMVMKQTGKKQQDQRPEAG